MSNDPTCTGRWSVFWSRGSSRTNPPSQGNVYVGSCIAEDTNGSRSPESIGYIVFNSDQGNIGMAYKAGITNDSIRGSDSPSASYSYSISGAFSSAPQVVIASQAGMDGADGGWAVLHGDQTTNQLSFKIDEDQIRNQERRHTSEQVAYVAFESVGVIALSETF